MIQLFRLDPSVFKFKIVGLRRLIPGFKKYIYKWVHVYLIKVFPKHFVVVVVESNGIMQGNCCKMQNKSLKCSEI